VCSARIYHLVLFDGVRSHERCFRGLGVALIAGSASESSLRFDRPESCSLCPLAVVLVAAVYLTQIAVWVDAALDDNGKLHLYDIYPCEPAFCSLHIFRAMECMLFAASCAHRCAALSLRHVLSSSSALVFWFSWSRVFVALLLVSQTFWL
jgi:hypothetical protein